jgi:hypothetical protein
MSEDTATQLETAVNALAVLSGTFHDGPKFGLVTLDLVAELATDGRGLLRLLIGMTAAAWLLIGIREQETGAGYDATWAKLGRRTQDLFPARSERRRLRCGQCGRRCAAQPFVGLRALPGGIGLTGHRD